MKILILGGTAEARQLAGTLVGLGHEVTTSMAGRTSDPMLPQGDLRTGNFGGVAGLAAYLRDSGTERLVDATHPYAETMSRNAVAAAQETGVALVRYMRPPWQPRAGNNWISVPDAAEAAAALPAGARVMLTTGHTGLASFLDREDCRFVVRAIEAPAIAMPRHAKLLLSRPPYGLAEELALLERERTTHLVSKNSGGAQTSAKLEAAQQLGIIVIMIERPAYAPAVEVASIEEAVAALKLAD